MGNNMGRRKDGDLLGSIERRGRSVRFIYRMDGRKKCIKIPGGDMTLARQVQRDMTNKYERGELVADSGFALVPEVKKQELARADITPVEFVAEYMERLKVRRRRTGGADETPVEDRGSYKNDKRCIDRFFDYLRPARMGNITTQYWDKFVAWRQNKVVNATVNRGIAVLKPMLAYAYKMKYITVDVASEINSLHIRRDKAVVVFPSLEMIEQLARDVEEHMPDFLAIFWCYLKTGLRRMECAEFLKDWVRRDVNVVTPYASKSNKRFILRTDTDIHDLLLTLQHDPTNRTPYLFLDGKGQRWTKAKLRRRMEKLAGLTDVPSEFVHYNVLRHTFASCITKAQGLAVASAYLAHSDYNLTRNHYANIFLDYVKFGDPELPYNYRKVHGDKIGDNELVKQGFRVISGDELKSVTA